MAVRTPTSRDRIARLAQPREPRMRLVFPPVEPVVIDARAEHDAQRNERATIERFGTPIQGPTDPRWVLAVRAGEMLEGAMLAPERCEKLIQIGRMLGLSAFDANLVLAIVQDKARRGVRSEACAAAGEEQLAMIALPQRQSFKQAAARCAQAIKPRHAAFWITLLLAAELAVVWWFLLR